MNEDNPYQAPESNLQMPPQSADGVVVLNAPRSVGIGRGFGWLKEAAGLVFRSPGIWVLNIIIFFAIIMVLAFIPFLGGLVQTLITPVLTAGLVYCAYQADVNGRCEVEHLFRGFKEETSKLLTLGAIMLGVTVVIMIVLFGFIFGVIGVDSFADMTTAPPDPAVQSQQGMLLLLSVLIALAVFIPVQMAFWFAPALVIFHKIPVGTALSMSFKGCLKNIMPFFWYGILAYILLLLGMLALFVGLLIAVPIITASIYTAYKDIFAYEA